MLFDLYVPTPGWLQRLDPRTKLALVGLGALLFLATRDPLPLALLVALLHGGLRVSRVPWGRMGWLLAQLRWVLGIILLLFPWLSDAPGRVLLQLGPLDATDAGVLLALATALRLWGMSLLVMALLFTTAQAALVRGLVALGLPYRWGLTLTLALRYIPSLARQVEQIQEAQQARGWDVARGDLLKRLRGLTPLFVALTIHVFRTADTLTMAMVARGVGRPPPRTERRPLRLTARDGLTLTLALVGALLWLRAHR